MKLSYDTTWTEDDEVALDELLHLTEEQAEKLFVSKKTIVVPDSLKKAYERFLSDRDVERATNAPAIKDVSVAGSHAKLARDLADQIKNDDAINNRARLTIVSGEEVKRGPLALCLLLEKKWGNGTLSEKFPDHDAYGWERKVKHDDGTEEVIAASNNPAKWKVPGKSVKGNPIEITYDFYQVFADDTAFGEEIIAAQDACRKAQETYTDKGSTKTCENHTTASGDIIPLQGMTGFDLRAETKMWDQRRSALAGQYRAAVRLHKKLKTMQDEYKGVVVQVSKTPDGSLGRGQYPITVVNKDNVGEFKRFTPSNFLNLDMDAATKNGGTYENLLATVGKGTGGDGDTPVVVEAIKSAAQADEYIAELVSYLQKKKPSGEFALMVYMNQTDKDKNKVHDDLILSCRELENIMNSINSKNEKRLAEIDEQAEAKTA